MRALAALFLCVSVGLAQPPIPVGPVAFPLDLRTYLLLTADQIAKINGLNAQVQSFQLDRVRRAAQVQSEIAAETAKPSPDPMELGVRYFELEAIRRQLADQQKSTVDQIQALLNADQKSKVS